MSELQYSRFRPEKSINPDMKVNVSEVDAALEVQYFKVKKRPVAFECKQLFSSQMYKRIKRFLTKYSINFKEL